MGLGQTNTELRKVKHNIHFRADRYELDPSLHEKQQTSMHGARPHHNDALLGQTTCTANEWGLWADPTLLYPSANVE